MKNNRENELGKIYHTNNCGNIKIVGYNNCSDVTVEFEDGTIREHCTMDRVRKVNIANKVKGNYKTHKMCGRIYETNNCGSIKIVKYNNSRDVTVQFDDGEIKEHCNIDCIRKGNIAKDRNNKRKIRIGEIYDTNNSGRIEIIDYNNAHDVTVKFEDGTIKYHCNMWCIIRGYVKIS